MPKKGHGAVIDYAGSVEDEEVPAWNGQITPGDHHSADLELLLIPNHKPLHRAFSFLHYKEVII